MKLVCHNGPNHPAKYGCLGVRSYKVGFSLVNRVSLIFNTIVDGVRCVRMRDFTTYRRYIRTGTLVRSKIGGGGPPATKIHNL